MEWILMVLNFCGLLIVCNMQIFQDIVPFQCIIALLPKYRQCKNSWLGLISKKQYQKGGRQTKVTVTSKGKRSTSKKNKPAVKRSIIPGSYREDRRPCCCYKQNRFTRYFFLCSVCPNIQTIPCWHHATIFSQQKWLLHNHYTIILCSSSWGFEFFVQDQY